MSNTRYVYITSSFPKTEHIYISSRVSQAILNYSDGYIGWHSDTACVKVRRERERERGGGGGEGNEKET